MTRKEIKRYVSNLLDDDEVTPEEAAFMLGYYSSNN